MTQGGRPASARDHAPRAQQRAPRKVPPAVPCGTTFGRLLGTPRVKLPPGSVAVKGESRAGAALRFAPDGARNAVRRNAWPAARPGAETRRRASVPPGPGAARLDGEGRLRTPHGPVRGHARRPVGRCGNPGMDRATGRRTDRAETLGSLQ